MLHDQPIRLDQYNTILFDLNGTLLGYEDPHGFERRFAQACCDLGHTVGWEQVSAVLALLMSEWYAFKASGARRASSGDQYRQTMTGWYQRMLAGLEVPGELWPQADALYERFILREGFMPVFGDVHHALARLQSRGLRLGILSNFPPHLEDTLRLHGIHRYFHFFVVSSLVGIEKPDPAIFELAIRQAACPREQILYVGDTPADDIAGARSVGLPVLLIDRHNRWPDADAVRIRSLSELG